MRIVHSIQALFAVLSLAVTFSPVYCYDNFNESLSFSRPRRSVNRHRHEWDDLFYRHQIPLTNPGKLLNVRENQMLLRHEAKNRSLVDCCPSVLEMVEPEGGKNQEDQYVELYRDGTNRQRFYELSCHKDIVGKPCRFIDKKLHNQSRCIQKYSYTYALVKDPGGTGKHNFPAFPSTDGATFTLDYIRVRSGCSCVVAPNAKKKRDKKLNKKRGRHEDVEIVSDNKHDDGESAD